MKIISRSSSTQGKVKVEHESAEKSVTKFQRIFEQGAVAITFVTEDDREILIQISHQEAKTLGIFMLKIILPDMVRNSAETLDENQSKDC